MDAFNKMGCSGNEWKEYTLNINYRTDMRLLEEFSELFNYMGERNLIPYIENKDKLIGSTSNQLLSSDELIEKITYSKEDEEDDIYRTLFENIKQRKAEIESNPSFSKLSPSEKTIAILVRNKFSDIKNIKTSEEPRYCFG